MTLAFTTTTSDGVYRDYVHLNSSLVERAPVLTPIHLPEDQLVTGSIHGQQQAIDLPVDRIDDEDFSRAFQQLTQAWQAVVASTVSTASDELVLLIQCQKQLRLCRKTMQETERLIKWLTARILLLTLGIRNQPERLGRYKTLLAKSRTFLVKLNDEHLLLSTKIVDLSNL